MLTRVSVSVISHGEVAIASPKYEPRLTTRETHMSSESAQMDTLRDQLIEALPPSLYS
jgi:hypothetical protein